MEKKRLYGVVIFIMGIMLIFTLVGCGGNEPGGGGDEDGDSTGITFTSVTATGSVDESTTILVLSFSDNIPGLTADDITISGVAGVQKEELVNNATPYYLPISGFTAGGELTVSVAKSGYTISGSPKKVTIYYASEAGEGSWTAVTDTTFGSTTINAIAYGNGKFVITGPSNSSSSKAAYSSDGITWTAGTHNFYFDKVVYLNNTFVGYSTDITHSADGVTWTKVADNPFDGSFNFINDIAYGGGKWVAVGNDGEIAVSEDGENWSIAVSSTNTIFTAGNYNDVLSAAYGNGKFVVGTQSGQVAYSTDGETWTLAENTTFSSHANGFMCEIYDILFAAGTFTAVGNSGTTGTSENMAYSADGETWIAVTDTTFSDRYPLSIVYANGTFIAGGYNGIIGQSADAITWTVFEETGFTDLLNSRIYGIAYGAGKFVAVGSNLLSASGSSTSHIAYWED